MPEAVPWSRSGTPVAAVMNMVVKTMPSPMLSATRPGIRSVYEPSGAMAKPRATAPSAPTASAPVRVALRPNLVTSRPAVVEPATTTAVGMRKPAPVCRAS